MSTTKKANTKAPIENMTAQTQRGSLDAAGGSQEPEQTINQLNPETPLDDPEVQLNDCDLTFKWNVKLATGTGTVLAHYAGRSTMNRILSPENLAMAPEKASEELHGKIILPGVAALQAEANRRALEKTDGDQNEDLSPLT